ncbi:hypothetical protein KA005_78570, partial [bacterium]|nr:hypothetical protein [bacterium]
MKLGVYALSWGALHSKDPISASIDKNLVFDFCITAPLSQDDKMEIRNVFNTAESFFKGKCEKEILNKFVYFNSGKGASDSDLRLFTKVCKEADLRALRIINIAPSCEKGQAKVDIEVFFDAKHSTETTDVYVYKIEENWYVGGIEYAVSVSLYNDQVENSIEGFIRELGEGNPYQKLLARSGLKKFRAYWLHYRKQKMNIEGKQAKEALNKQFSTENPEFFKIVNRGKD